MKPDMRILIVDDSLVARRLLVTYLNEMGIQNITEAGNGEEGLLCLDAAVTDKAHPPFDLIITDLRMPALSGVGFLSRLKDDPIYKTIPKLICSVESDKAVLLNAVLSGADSYILKPVTLPVLREKIDKAMARKKAG